MSSSPSELMSDYMIRKEGWRALTERLGISGAVRFLMQYDTGHGDYTEERKALFDHLTAEEVLKAVKEADADH